MKLLLNTPFWYLLICLLIGALGAYFLYRKDKNLSEISSFWKKTLVALRFISISILSFLLLEPLLEYSKEKVEKPIVILAHDNSQSMILSKDSSEVMLKLKQEFDNLKSSISDDYEIFSYSFGNEINENSTFDFSDRQTNISGFFKEIQERYFNRNLGGIVLATDGIYNKGNNPLFQVKEMKQVPVFTVGIGDTNKKKDVFIDQLSYNRLVYQGNKFPLEVLVTADQFKGRSTVVKVLKGSTIVGQKTITFGKDVSQINTLFELDAEGSGIQNYKVVVNGLENEYTLANNYKSFYVDVLKSKQKILLLSNSPHPDVNAIKSALSTNENYEITSVVASEFSENITDFSLVVLFNLPSNDNTISVLKNSNVSRLFVVGNQTSYARFNSENTEVSINSAKGYTQAQVYFNSDFSGFTVTNSLATFSNAFNPVQVPFTRNYKLGNASEVALYQKIGPAKTNYPLLVFSKTQNNKSGVLIGEGFWRWKLQDYSINGSNEMFNELITQTAQYLVSKEDKSFFRVFGESSYDENEKVKFEAEVYNKSYELINDADVKMKISNERGEDFSYLFSKKGKRYALNAGSISAGKYNYAATTVVAGKTQSKSGVFTVDQQFLEQNNSVADHQLLYNLSDVTGGKLISLNDVSQLKDEFANQENMVNVLYKEKEVDDLINLKLIFFILLFLLSLEWFVRKRNGAY